MATKACAGATLSVPRTGSTSVPRRERTVALSPSTIRKRNTSCGCRPSVGSGVWPNRRPSVPVRLMPCHWSRRRPVFSAKGKRASRGSATGS
jgi:hypothetical protein